ncbi:MAG: amidohydrolase family protein [Thermodesulfovibrionales bacterium]|nr:amidohydrolase family protein [Thermodesulfovibrionales bacterium]
MRLIDIHTHGLAGADTRTEDPEDIIRMALAHGSSGVSGIVPAIYPGAAAAMRKNMSAVREAMEKQQGAGPAQIIGVHLEGPFLNPLRCGALDKGSFLKPTEYNLKSLVEGFEDMIRIITLAPEIDGAQGLIRRIRDMGIAVSMGHSDATYEEAEAGFKAGATGITHIFNAMSGFRHRQPGLAAFGLLNREVYIEVICDPFHLHPKTIELIFRTKNPERIIIISDSIKGTRPGERGTTPVADGSGRLLGGSMTIAESSKRLMDMGLAEDVIMRCISENPEGYLLS